MKEKTPEEIIYMVYPKKVGRKHALKAIYNALKEKNFEELYEATTSYNEEVIKWSEEEKKYVPMPATWFNQGRYDDDRTFWKREIVKRPTHFAKEKSKFTVRK